jgi:hypothetical protein
MQRDWDLVRKILLAVEAQQTIMGQVEPASIQGYDEQNVVYHMMILGQAGFINIRESKSINRPPYCVALLLTWEGQDFLDKIREDNLWQKVKGIARDKGLDLSVDVIKLGAKTAIKAMFPVNGEEG